MRETEFLKLAVSGEITLKNSLSMEETASLKKTDSGRMKQLHYRKETALVCK